MDIKLNILILLGLLILGGISYVLFRLKQLFLKLNDVQLTASILDQKYDESTKRLSTKIEQTVASAAMDITQSSTITPKYDDSELYEEILSLIGDEDSCSTDFIQKTYNSGYSQVVLVLNKLEQDGLIKQSSDVNGNITWKIIDESKEFEEEEV